MNSRIAEKGFAIICIDLVAVSFIRFSTFSFGLFVSQTFFWHHQKKISFRTLISFPLVPCLFKMCLISWPPVLLLAAFSRTTHPNNFTLNTSVPRVLSNTPAKCKVDRMNGCRDNRRADRDSFHLQLDVLESISAQSNVACSSQQHLLILCH